MRTNAETSLHFVCVCVCVCVCARRGAAGIAQSV